MNRRKSTSAIGPRKAPKQDRSRQTYQVILNGATSIIRRDGLKKLSTNKVAEESGVSIGSLYQYFPSKAAIVAALIDQVLDDEFNRVKTLIESMPPSVGPREIAKTFFLQYFRPEGEELALRKTLVEAVPSVERAENAMKFHQRMAGMLINYFQAHFNFRKDDDLRTEMFLLQYLSKGVVLASIDDQMKEFDRDRIAGELADIFSQLFKIPEDTRTFTN